MLIFRWQWGWKVWMRLRGRGVRSWQEKSRLGRALAECCPHSPPRPGSGWRPGQRDERALHILFHCTAWLGLGLGLFFFLFTFIILFLLNISFVLLLLINIYIIIVFSSIHIHLIVSINIWNVVSLYEFEQLRSRFVNDTEPGRLTLQRILTSKD